MTRSRTLMVGFIGGGILGFVGIVVHAHVVVGVGFALAGVTLILQRQAFAGEVVRANEAMRSPLRVRAESAAFMAGLGTFIGIAFTVAGAIIAVYG